MEDITDFVNTKLPEALTARPRKLIPVEPSLERVDAPIEKMSHKQHVSGMVSFDWQIDAKEAAKASIMAESVRVLSMLNENSVKRKTRKAQSGKSSQSLPASNPNGDVYSGKGETVKRLNKHYREIIVRDYPKYHMASSDQEKRDVAQRIFEEIKGGGGRFLDSSLEEMSPAKAHEKIMKALKDARDRCNRQARTSNHTRLSSHGVRRQSRTTKSRKMSNDSLVSPYLYVQHVIVPSLSCSEEDSAYTSGSDSSLDEPKSESFSPTPLSDMNLEIDFDESLEFLEDMFSNPCIDGLDTSEDFDFTSAVDV